MKTACLAMIIATAVAITAISAFAAGTTAKVAFDAATAVARQWQADAVPVSISAVSVQSDGTATSWSYIFFSPQRQQGYSVATRDGEIVDRGEVTGYLKDEIGNEFVDSDQALAEAGKNGLSGSSDTTMSLVVMGQATATPGSYWTISRGFNADAVSVVVDAKNGKFSFRDQMP